MKYFAGSKTVIQIVSLLVILSSAMGLLVPEFYASRNNAITTFEIAGQDIVSLACGVLLLLFVAASKRGMISSIVITGLLIYTTYTYAYFAFGIITSKIFILYLLIAGLSFYSIISTVLGLTGIADQEANSIQKAASIYMIAVVALVGLIDGRDIIARTIGTSLMLDPKGAYYVLDLAFLFPGMAIAAVMNMKGQMLGRFFTGAFLVKTITLMPALILADFLHYANKGAFVDLGFDVIAFVVLVTAATFYWLYYKDMVNSF